MRKFQGCHFYNHCLQNINFQLQIFHIKERVLTIDQVQNEISVSHIFQCYYIKVDPT